MIVRIFALLFLLMSFSSNAFALFTDEYSDNRPVFKDDYRDWSLYFIVSPGAMVYNQLGSLSTIDPGNDKFITALGAHAKDSQNASYSTYFNFGIGYKVTDSIIRHELDFSYFNISGNTVDGLDTEAATVTSGATSTSISYLNYGGQYSKSLQTNMKMYKLMYRLYLNFDDAFKIGDSNCDLFAAGGVGLALINGDVLSKSYYTLDSANAPTATLTTSDSGVSLLKTSTLSVSYDASIGMIYNINSYLAAQVAIKYSATTRPLFDSNFSSITASNSSSMNMISFVGLELGMILKAM